MPEGDTIFRAARTLHRAFAGHVVTRFDAQLAQIRDVDRATPFAGRTVKEISARGKHLLMSFDGSPPLTLRTHMRMNGSWHVYRPGEVWRRGAHRARIVIETSAFVAVAFDVQEAEVLTAAGLARHERLGKLGPDLLAPRFDEDEAIRRLRERPEHTLEEALLDQRVVAGAGNVFKSEILFTVRVHPERRVGELDDETLRGLLKVARRYLLTNVGERSGGGMVTYTGFRRTTGRSDPSARLWVYGRMDEPCRVCGTPIQMRRHGEGSRSTYFCPRCQPFSAPARSTREPPS